MNKHEALDIVLGLVGGATVALLLLPTPDKFAELFMLHNPPRVYIVFYNLVRYAANLNYTAGWQPTRNNKPDARLG